MSEYLIMSGKWNLLRDIKNYLKKLKCGQLEIGAGQWELHKDILNMKRMFNELKEFKKDLEEMKKSNLEQMGIIRMLQLTLSQQSDNICVKNSSDCNETDEICRNTDKRIKKNYSKDLKKKTHMVQSEEIIEITSHVESSEGKSISDCTSESSKDRKRKREGKKFLRSPIRSIIYFRNLTPGSGMANPGSCFPPNNKDDAMLQRYLNDSVKYCDERVSNPGMDVSKSAEVCESNHKEDDQCKSDSWKRFSSKPRNSNSRDRSSNGNFMSHNEETIKPKMVRPHNKKRKAVVMSSSFNDKCKRKKKKSPYVCEVCEKGFHTKNLLRAHEVVHKKMSAEAISYKCDYCDNVYKTPKILEKHTRKCQLIKSLFRKS